MSEPFKLLFDENIGKPIGAAIANLLRFHFEPPEIAFVIDRFGGVTDDIWVPKIASESWVLFSNDRAKRCGGPKLPEVCRQHGVTHILSTGAIHSMKQFAKAVAILSVWDEIVATRRAPSGTRFCMRLLNGKPHIAPCAEKSPKIIRLPRSTETGQTTQKQEEDMGGAR